jgi:hypothetical protein
VKKLLLFSVIAVLSVCTTTAQTTYLPLRTEEYSLLDRLETLEGRLSDDFFSSLKPIPRKGAVAFLKKQKSKGMYQANNLSEIDLHNIARAISISGEWGETAEGDDATEHSRRPILKYFYERRPDLLHVSTDDFFLVVNPVIYAQALKEKDADGLKYINTRGAEIRGRIFNRVGFYTMLADNQEKAAGYIDNWANANSAFPGADYYIRTNSGAYDIFMARGYVDAGAFNDHFSVTFGFDKNFSGDGMRSLLLSDFSAAATFLRLRTRIWKLTYENLYLELTPDFIKGGDKRLPRKYAAIHQLSMNVTDWLNIGIFESTMFSRSEQFNADYLIPVIFYRTAARAFGGDDKTSLGINFKAIALNHLQFYGQGYFDQLKLGELGKGWWGNQFGVQLGAKYFNAFTLANLDLQAEANIVRPFTYAANDGVSNYTNYNQPLAHPYGAGFSEFIGIARYQPLKELYLTLKGIYSLRGTDTSAGVNYGNSVFKRYDMRQGDGDYGLTPGDQVRGLYLNFNAAYEVRPNIFLEAGVTHLQRKYESNIYSPSTTLFYGGLRWNIARKEYDHY